MEKYFKLTEETIEWQGHTLHRIEATRDSYWAKAGDLGGFVESEDSLRGDAWVADNSKVWGSAYLLDRSLARDTSSDGPNSAMKTTPIASKRYASSPI